MHHHPSSRQSSNQNYGRFPQRRRTCHLSGYDPTICYEGHRKIKTADRICRSQTEALLPWARVPTTGVRLRVWCAFFLLRSPPLFPFHSSLFISFRPQQASLRSSSSNASSIINSKFFIPLHAILHHSNPRKQFYYIFIIQCTFSFSFLLLCSTNPHSPPAFIRLSSPPLHFFSWFCLDSFHPSNPSSSATAKHSHSTIGQASTAKNGPAGASAGVLSPLSSFLFKGIHPSLFFFSVHTASLFFFLHWAIPLPVFHSISHQKVYNPPSRSCCYSLPLFRHIIDIIYRSTSFYCTALLLHATLASYHIQTYHNLLSPPFCSSHRSRPKHVVVGVLHTQFNTLQSNLFLFALAISPVCSRPSAIFQDSYATRTTTSKSYYMHMLYFLSYFTIRVQASRLAFNCTFLLRFQISSDSIVIADNLSLNLFVLLSSMTRTLCTLT
ncbi:hypothetical protein SCHPADRAFT_174750 [Schizopora paradoxa]|uniref:Uncharacterized protein n=1 Tax=Schizopora paradoxa TaxID=27342 RepID=A0A0H2S019_9AGAM|nr:hypothetical protein SCHPADRAFT_174750 [Schizopora paradoxa]